MYLMGLFVKVMSLPNFDVFQCSFILLMASPNWICGPKKTIHLDNLLMDKASVMEICLIVKVSSKVILSHHSSVMLWFSTFDKNVAKVGVLVPDRTKT